MVQSLPAFSSTIGRAIKPDASILRFFSVTPVRISWDNTF
jgi:hypothetical protein